MLNSLVVDFIYIGPEKNDITDVLMGVNWKQLCYQLKLQGKKRCTAIESACNDAKNADKAACYLMELINEFINSQPYEQCKITVGKIAEALKDLHYMNKATHLQTKFGIGIIIKYNYMKICLR